MKQFIQSNLNSCISFVSTERVIGLSLVLFKMSMLQCQYWYLSTLCKTTGYFELTGHRAKEFHKILATYRAQNRTLACAP